MTQSPQKKLQRRRARVRATVFGTSERPRLSVKITLHHVVGQLVDDTRQVTLAYVTTVGSEAKGTMTEKAVWVGTEVAKKAGTKKIKRVVFDRNGRIYHGRLHALADAARAQGLEF